eukprot:6462484-Amphidinium_carterae.2
MICRPALDLGRAPRAIYGEKSWIELVLEFSDSWMATIKSELQVGDTKDAIERRQLWSGRADRCKVAMSHGAPRQVLTCFHYARSLDELTAAMARWIRVRV